MYVFNKLTGHISGPNQALYIDCDTLSIQDGSEGTVGHVFMSVDTIGTGSWQALSAANKTLSNLTAPTAINADLIFGAGVEGNIKTPNATSTSKNLNFVTGNSTNSYSGDMNFNTGSALATTQYSGSFYFTSGNVTDGQDSGWFGAYTGQATSGTTGSIDLYTGTATTGQTGRVEVQTGKTNSGGVTGEIHLYTGSTDNPSAVVSGDIKVKTGDAFSGTSGNITLQTGSVTSGTRGNIELNGQIKLTGSVIKAIRSVSTNATISKVTDSTIMCDLTPVGGNFTLTLPVGVDGLEYTIKGYGTPGGCDYTLAASGGNTLDADLSGSLPFSTTKTFVIQFYNGVWYLMVRFSAI